MTNTRALREFVLSRLGSPEPLLPGESYPTGTPSTDWAYRRWARYLDETDYEIDADAVGRFVAELEAKRDRDFQAFHCGRGLLLDALPILVERERDPNPSAGAPTTKVVLRSFGGLDCARLREKVIAKLGRPAGGLPGECLAWLSTDALWEMTLLRDRLEYDLSERSIEEAIVAIAAMRERDQEAFEYGRDQLLGVLAVELALPKRVATQTARA